VSLVVWSAVRAGAALSMTGGFAPSMFTRTTVGWGNQSDRAKKTLRSCPPAGTPGNSGMQ
jgi:hypothetical protein